MISLSQRRLVHPDKIMLKDSICSVEECDRLCLKGMWLEDFSPLCHMHTTRWRRTGDNELTTNGGDPN